MTFRGQKESIHLLETRDEGNSSYLCLSLHYVHHQMIYPLHFVLVYLVLAGKADGRFAAVQNLVKKDV